MILLDTHVLIWDALASERLSKQAAFLLDQGEQENRLYCSDISLWEIAMLVNKKRLEIEIDSVSFMQTVLTARNIQVLPITPEIAELSVVVHFDPADRLIAATPVFIRQYY